MKRLPEDCLEWTVVALYQYVTPIDVEMKLLAGKNDSEQLLFDLCVTLLSIGQCSGRISHWKTVLQDARAQSSARTVSLDDDLFGTLDASKKRRTGADAIFALIASNAC